MALEHATRLLRKNPILAAEQAAEILKVVPGHPHARLVLGAAERLSGRSQDAVTMLSSLAREQARSVPVHLELGLALGEAGRTGDAVAAFRHALRLAPESPDGWRLLADQLDAVGDPTGADQARARYLKAANQDPQLLEAAAALVDNDLPRADTRLRSHLAGHPTDVAALRMLAEVAGRLRRYADAEQLLARCLELAPSFDAARHNYAMVLNRQAKAAQALPQVQRLLEKEPRNPGYRNLQAAVLAQLGDYAGSIEVYEAVLKDHPQQPKIWMSYGHALKTAGRREDSIGAYRRAIQLEPTLGEAYWSLANLKTFRFGDGGCRGHARARYRGAGSAPTMSCISNSRSARPSRTGNRTPIPSPITRRATRCALEQHPYSAQDHAAFIRRSKDAFTAEFFASRRGAGSPARDPIFIVGMPRAGSTLLEQILASHSQVEGTMELPTLPQIARELAGNEEGFLPAVASLSDAGRRALGERYLAETRIQRKTAAPFFIDKMPNNFLYVGLIHLILPNATIIDARRHPMACCFSMFKQHFARGQNFAYGLGDIGAYYRDYVELMAHFDAVLPGRVHRMFHESVIEDTESQIRRLLACCGLPFEETCLRFYDNERAVRTASSEQVRRPIFREGMEQWRNYLPWLGPLRDALGAVLDRYPEVPGTGTSAALQAPADVGIQRPSLNGSEVKS